MSRTVRLLVAIVLALPVVVLLALPADAAAAYSLSTTSLDFGSVAVGGTKSLPITITNTGNASGSPNFAGGAPIDPTNFGGSQNCAGKTFAPGDTCQFTYEFHPTTVGVKNSSTTIGIDTTNYPITMTGTGGTATTTTTTTSTTTTTKPTTTTTTTTTRPSGGGGGATAATAASTTTVAGQERATVSHADIAPGDQQSATANGFKPGELVSAVMQPEGTDLGSRVADAQGVVRFQWAIPDDATPGTHEFVATGATSGSATATFTVAEKSDDSSSRPWLIVALVAVALAAVGGVVYLVRRVRRGRTADADPE